MLRVSLPLIPTTTASTLSLHSCCMSCRIQEGVGDAHMDTLTTVLSVLHFGGAGQRGGLMKNKLTDYRGFTAYVAQFVCCHRSLTAICSVAICELWSLSAAAHVLHFPRGLLFQHLQK